MMMEVYIVEKIEHPDIAHIIATGYPPDISQLYMLCPTCGSRIYSGDSWFPDWNACENCIDNFKDTLNIDE